VISQVTEPEILVRGTRIQTSLVNKGAQLKPVIIFVCSSLCVANLECTQHLLAAKPDSTAKTNLELNFNRKQIKEKGANTLMLTWHCFLSVEHPCNYTY